MKAVQLKQHVNSPLIENKPNKDSESKILQNVNLSLEGSNITVHIICSVS